MAIRIEKQGQRLYLLGDTYGVKNQIKTMGGHWDGERRAWWIGAKKLTEIETFIATLGEPAAPNATDATDAPKAKQDPHDIRLTGKARYKGREYFVGSVTRDGLKVRLLTLPDANGDYLDFWALCSEVEQTKTYQPHEQFFRGRVTTTYTTLGGIADFVARERKNNQAGGAVCAECGKSGELVQDLEDGMMKHRRCCDIES